MRFVFTSHINWNLVQVEQQPFPSFTQSLGMVCSDKAKTGFWLNVQKGPALDSGSMSLM